MKLGAKFILNVIMLFVTASILSAQSKPNIVIILADDLGYGAVNCYGAPKSLLRTPHVDQLAREGMRFTDASTPGSVCSPTRYALLTGRYAWRGRLKYGVLQPPEGALLIEEELLTLPDYLQQQRYLSAHIGKWQLGYANMENEEIWGLRSRGKAPYGKSSYKNQRYHGYDAPQRVTTEVVGDLNNKAREWIFKCVREDPEKPFFLYFAQVAVHNPISPAEELRGSSNCGPYGDYIHDLDHSVGEILDALAYSGVLDNTIVIFTSDNGGDVGENEVIRDFKLPVNHVEEAQARKAGLKNNGIFRGDKHTIWEGGFRVPFVVRWPGHIQPGTVSDRMINLVDIFATVQDLVSGKVFPPKEAGADSYSFCEELTGESNAGSVRPHMVVNSINGTMAIRRGPWRVTSRKQKTSLKNIQKFTKTCSIPSTISGNWDLNG